MIVLTCPGCGAHHKRKPSFTKNNGRFCSIACSAKYRRSRPLRSFEALFWGHMEKTAACWFWTGATVKDGYGTIRVGGRQAIARGAHRVSWELHNGPIPSGQLVLHTCDTPACVNPNHLFLGTHQDNADDKIAKGRDRSGWNERTHCKRGHCLVPENIYISPIGAMRQCRTCQREGQFRRYHQRRHNAK